MKTFKVISYQRSCAFLLAKHRNAQPPKTVWAVLAAGVPESYGDTELDEDGFRRITDEFATEEEALDALASWIIDCREAKELAKDFE